jgi:hypothetical protein
MVGLVLLDSAITYYGICVIKKAYEQNAGFSEFIYKYGFLLNALRAISLASIPFGCILVLSRIGGKYLGNNFRIIVLVLCSTAFFLPFVIINISNTATIISNSFGVIEGFNRTAFCKFIP